MTAPVLTRDGLKELVELSRVFNRLLEITTNSGTVYLLDPCDDKVWDVRREGCDGTTSIHRGVRAYLRGDQLVIGPWQTTGLSKIVLL